MSFKNGAPVNVGESFYLVVIGFGASGDPFGLVDGFVIFIKGLDKVVLGAKYFVEVTGIGKSCGFSRFVRKEEVDSLDS